MVLLIGCLLILMYAGITVFSMYIAVVGQQAPDAGKKWMGRLLINHGKSWIVGLISMAVLTGAMVFSKIIMALFQFQVRVDPTAFIHWF